MKFSVKMTAKDLFDFSMYNSYSGAMGLFNVIFTFAALVLLIVTWGSTDVYQKVLLAFCVLIFTVIQPAMLHVTSKKQAEMHGFSTPVNLTLTDEKIAVEQAGVEGEILWSQVWKAARIPSMFILKVGPSHAYLLPNAAVEGREEELLALLKKNLPEKKTKGLKA